MSTPVWTKPALYGVGLGVIATAIVGFSWGGWVTAAKADAMADERAHDAVVSVLAPICVAQSKADPQAAETLAKLKGTSLYRRGEVLMEAGWATMPGSEDPDRAVARACAETLAEAL